MAGNAVGVGVSVGVGVGVGVVVGVSVTVAVGVGVGSGVALTYTCTISVTTGGSEFPQATRNSPTMNSSTLVIRIRILISLHSTCNYGSNAATNSLPITATDPSLAQDMVTPTKSTKPTCVGSFIM